MCFRQGGLFSLDPPIRFGGVGVGLLAGGGCDGLAGGAGWYIHEGTIQPMSTAWEPAFEGDRPTRRDYQTPEDYGAVATRMASREDPFEFFRSDKDERQNIPTVEWIKTTFGIDDIRSVQRSNDNRMPDSAVPSLMKTFEIKHPSSVGAAQGRARIGRTQSRVLVLDLTGTSLTRAQAREIIKGTVHRFGGNLDQVLVIHDERGLLWTSGN